MLRTALRFVLEMLRALGYIPEPRAIAYKRRLSQLSNEEEKDELDSEEEDVINVSTISEAVSLLNRYRPRYIL